MKRAAVQALIGVSLAFELFNAASAQTSGKDRLSRLVPIDIHIGSNLIPRFSNDGRTALVTLGWRDNGNAWGFRVYEVMLPTKAGRADWNVVTFGKDMTTQVTDTPHTGEDALRSVRLVHGRLDGQPQTMLITATRAIPLEGGAADASPPTIEVQVLRQDLDETPGTPHDYFEPVFSFQAVRPYCHTDMTLKQELGLPLPPRYQGGKTPDGC